MNLKKGVKGFVKVPLEERFWSRVQKGAPSECWLWTGTKDINNYGTIWVDGRHVKAQRVAWSLHHCQPFPKDKLGCHSCDNPPCVNPLHIWPGTKKENSRDAVNKGRLKTPKMPPKSHCSRGHEMVPANVIKHHQKGRICRACRDLRNRARYDRQALNDTIIPDGDNKATDFRQSEDGGKGDE